MIKMKGAAQFIIGLMMIVLVTIIFVVDKNQTYSRHMEIASASVKIYEIENDAESLKRTIDSAVYFLSLRSLKETFENSGAWTGAGPTGDDIRKDFEKRFSEKLNSFSPQKIGNSNVKMEILQLESEFLDSGVRVFGSRNFTIKSAGNPAIEFPVAGSFDREIPIGANKVFAAGKELLAEGEWKIDRAVVDAEPEECKKIVEGSSLEGDFHVVKINNLPPTSISSLEGDFYVVKINNLLSTSVKCGYASTPGALFESSYEETAVRNMITAPLDVLAAFMNDKNKFDFTFTPSVSAKEENGKTFVSVNVAVSVSDKNSQVPSETNFVPLVLKYSTLIEFEMPAPPAVSEG